MRKLNDDELGSIALARDLYREWYDILETARNLYGISVAFVEVESSDEGILKLSAMDDQRNPLPVDLTTAWWRDTLEANDEYQAVLSIYAYNPERAQKDYLDAHIDYALDQVYSFHYKLSIEVAKPPKELPVLYIDQDEEFTYA
jgi:hypothetical protein